MKNRAKTRISFLRDLQRELEYKIEQIAENVMDEKIPMIDAYTGDEVKGLYDDMQWFFVSDDWDCSESPFGWCMYHRIHDPAHDGCVFCGQPQERK